MTQEERSRRGRRRSDRWRLAIGVAIGATLVAYAMYTQGCDAQGPTRPEDPAVAAPPPAPVAAATPAPSATPAAGQPAAGRFELTCSASSTISVKNNNTIPAALATWYTSFDNQNLAFDIKQHVVNAGDTLTRSFNQVCIQGDADQPGVKEIGGCFYDINGKPFNPSKEPAKTTECRNRCIPEDREATTKEYGEWGECKRGETQEGCYQSRKVTTIITTVNTCTKETKEKSRTVSYETRSCECPCVEREAALEIPGQAVWNPAILQGRCEVEVGPIGIDSVQTNNCHQNGTQVITLDWLCKADDTRTRNLCRNVPCPCVYPQASHSNTAFVEEDRNQHPFFTDWWVVARAHVQGAATWKLEIYSASNISEYNNNDPDFTKASSTRTLTCDQAHNFNLEYHSENHGSDVWWAALYRDNVRVWKSQAEFN